MEVTTIPFGFHTVHFSPMFGGRAPLETVLRATAAAGFDAIGFDLPMLDAAADDGYTTERIRELLDELGLRCSDVVVLAAGVDADLVGTAHRLATVGERLGAPVCVAAVGAPVPHHELETTLRAAADILGDHGLRLAVEFTPYTPLSTLGAAVELAGAVGTDRCGLVLDTLHLSRSATPVDEVRSLSADDIALVQISDAPARAPADLTFESRHQRLLPGDGALPLDEWMDAIAATGYRGPVSAEVLSADLRAGEPADVAARCHTAMRRYTESW